MVWIASWSVVQSGQTVMAGKSNSFRSTLSMVLVLGFSSQSLKANFNLIINLGSSFLRVGRKYEDREISHWAGHYCHPHQPVQDVFSINKIPDAMNGGLLDNIITKCRHINICPPFLPGDIFWSFSNSLYFIIYYEAVIFTSWTPTYRNNKCGPSDIKDSWCCVWVRPLTFGFNY